MTPSERVTMQPDQKRLLDGKLAKAGRTVFWERLWRALAAPAAIVILYIAVSWLGLWVNMPRWMRAVGTILFAGAFIYSFRHLFALRFATTDDARSRLDRDAGVPHRPVEAATDTLALAADPTSKALWALHQRRAAEAIAKINVAAPEPALRKRDPLALRFAPVLLAIAGFFAAGPEWQARLTSGFQWVEPPPPPPPPRLDAWLDPPAYTGRPPQFLVRSQQNTDAAASASAATAPTGSTLVVRATPAEGVNIEISGKLDPVEAPEATGGAIEKRFRLTGEGELTITRRGQVLGKFPLSAIPDNPPEVTLGETRLSDQRDGLRINYKMKDDYGVAEAEARFSLPLKPGETPRRSLAAPPNTALPLPYNRQPETDGEANVATTEHPWAGARVMLQLHVKDDAGQTAQSESRLVTLPQRPFSNPLAKALVEQRRNLVIDPDRKDRVQIAIDALVQEPERFMARQTGAYMGLRLAQQRLRAARTDAKLLEVAEWLWTMALEIEDGGLSEAEKALRAAQERLQEALERNASPDEIRRLTEELRQAMNRYMREFAERAQRENRLSEQRNNENTRMLNRNDIQKMLEDIERLSREGRHAEAQELLRQLNEAMRNLQAQRGQPGQQGQQGERERGMNEAMNELDQMLRDQQELRDRTYRQGQERRRQGNQQAQRDRQQGQQGQRGQRGQQGQQGQQGQPGEQGEGQDGEGQGEGNGEGQESLDQRQEQLRQRLGQLQRRMRELGLGNEQGLSDAEGAMRDAEGQLRGGQEGRAVENQGRAMEGMRRGMQGMARQMQQQGEGEGQEQADGGPGNDDPNRQGQPRAGSEQRNADPLGRERNNGRAQDDARFRAEGNDAGTINDRARRVLDDLRRKLGEQERPRLELDYLERLLPRN
jgi:uncharacterized protein (TIGR02302 family)